MKTRIAICLALVGLVLNATCKPRAADNGTYQSGPGGATEEATATDRAETTVASLDSTRIIILRDSVKKEKDKL